MGYEVKMYIYSVGEWELEKNLNDNGNPKPMAEMQHVTGLLIGMIDLCKPGWDNPVGQLIQYEMKNEANMPTYLWASNGNDKIYTDSYGDRLLLVNGGEVLDAFRLEAETTKEPYRRFEIAHAMMEEILRTFPEKRIKCVFYGY